MRKRPDRGVIGTGSSAGPRRHRHERSECSGVAQRRFHASPMTRVDNEFDRMDHERSASARHVSMGEAWLVTTRNSDGLGIAVVPKARSARAKRRSAPDLLHCSNRTNARADRRHPEHPRLRQHRHNASTILGPTKHTRWKRREYRDTAGIAGEPENRKRIAGPLRRDRRRALRHHRSRDAKSRICARCATSIMVIPRWCCGRARLRKSQPSSSSPTRRRRRSCRRAATRASSAGRSRTTARSSSRSTAWTRSAKWTRRRTQSRRKPAYRSGACARQLPTSIGSTRCCCRRKVPARSAAISRPTRAAPRRSPGALRASRRSGWKSCWPTGACSTISTS